MQCWHYCVIAFLFHFVDDMKATIMEYLMYKLINVYIVAILYKRFTCYNNLDRLNVLVSECWYIFIKFLYNLICLADFFNLLLYEVKYYNIYCFNETTM